MMFGFLNKMKREMTVVEAFVLFFSVAIELNGGRYTIAVLGDIHAEIVLMRSCLIVVYLFPEVLMKLPYSLLLICWS